MTENVTERSHDGAVHAWGWYLSKCICLLNLIKIDEAVKEKLIGSQTPTSTSYIVSRGIAW